MGSINLFPSFNCLNILSDFGSAYLRNYFPGSNSTIHSMPYLSLNIAKKEPQGLSSKGISIWPPTENPLYSLSASSLLSALIEILLRFSFSLVSPMISGTLLPIKKLGPMGRAMCMIFSASCAGTGKSSLAMSLKRVIFENSPPNTYL